MENKKIGNTSLKQGCKLNSLQVLSTLDTVEDA